MGIQYAKTRVVQYKKAATTAMIRAEMIASARIQMGMFIVTMVHIDQSLMQQQQASYNGIELVVTALKAGTG